MIEKNKIIQNELWTCLKIHFLFCSSFSIFSFKFAWRDKIRHRTHLKWLQNPAFENLIRDLRDITHSWCTILEGCETSVYSHILPMYHLQPHIHHKRQQKGENLRLTNSICLNTGYYCASQRIFGSIATLQQL